MQTHTHNRFTSLLDFVWDYPGEKGKTNLDLLEQETVSGSGISWAICISEHHPRQITTPAQFFTSRMPFLPPYQQYQSTEGILN